HCRLLQLTKLLQIKAPSPELGEGWGGVSLKTTDTDICHAGIKRFLLFSKLFCCTFVTKLRIVLLKEVIYLVQKDFILEWRQKYAFNGMLLYVGSTVFICYLSFSMRFS